MKYAHPEYLTPAEDVIDGIERRDRRMRIFDTTVYLHPDPPRYRIESGRENYLKGHIPTAGLLDLTRGMSDASAKFPFTLPNPAQLQHEFRKYGIDDDSLVVLYSTTHIMWATRLWWMLHWAGHRNVTLLDGGYTQWIADGRPIDDEPTPYPTSSMTVRPQPGLWATRDEVRASIGDGSVCVINALAPDVYAGTAATNYGRPGHIPGSHNVYFGSVLNGQTFKSADEIADALDPAGVRRADRIITYCGGGISATVDAFALKLLGYDNVAVYDGSMAEWAGDPSMPLTTGSAP
ncbi:MAG TPA: sulfurtransferase [Pseudomonadales bacterium]|nr:sulfurtransferase [Pseudomonadales bacterium]